MLSDLANNQFVIQSTGCLAMVFLMLVFQAKKRKNILVLHSVANIFYALYFFLIGRMSGSVTALLISLRNYIFIYFGKQKNWVLPVLFMIIFVIFDIVTWQGWISILPTLGAIFGTMAFWLSNPRLIRLFSLAAPPMWFAYSVATQAYPIMIAELIIFFSDVVGIYRFDIVHKKAYQRVRSK